MYNTHSVQSKHAAETTRCARARHRAPTFPPGVLDSDNIYFACIDVSTRIDTQLTANYSYPVAKIGVIIVGSFTEIRVNLRYLCADIYIYIHTYVCIA